MVSLVDLERPENTFSGRIFWDMLRPGQSLAVFGPRGCTTSTVREIRALGDGAFIVRTRNTSYVLTEGDRPGADVLKALRLSRTH